MVIRLPVKPRDVDLNPSGVIGKNFVSDIGMDSDVDIGTLPVS